MIKIIEIEDMRLSDIEKMLNNNPTWKLITFGTNKRTEYDDYGSYHHPKISKIEENFMVVESISDDVEFKEY